MSPVLAVVVGAVSVVVTVAVLALVARARYASRLPGFRCRVGPPGVPWRRHARWRLRRTRAAWLGDVLVLRAGALRLWLDPVAVRVAGSAVVEPLDRHRPHGLGPHPVALTFTTGDGSRLEIAVAGRDADRLVGPFLTAALAGLPKAPRERGA